MAESHREEIAKLEALYASNPGGRVFVHLAEAYRKAGEHERARRILTEGLARHQDSASAYVVLGRVLVDSRNTNEAEAAFKRAIDLDSGNLIALRWLGDLARQSDRNDEAAVYYRELLARSPSKDNIRDLLALVEDPPAAALDAPAPVAAPPRAPAKREATRPEYGVIDLDDLPGDLASFVGLVDQRKAPEPPAPEPLPLLDLTAGGESDDAPFELPLDLSAGIETAVGQETALADLSLVGAGADDSGDIDELLAISGAEELTADVATGEIESAGTPPETEFSFEATSFEAPAESDVLVEPASSETEAAESVDAFEPGPVTEPTSHIEPPIEQDAFAAPESIADEIPDEPESAEPAAFDGFAVETATDLIGSFEAPAEPSAFEPEPVLEEPDAEVVEVGASDGAPVPEPDSILAEELEPAGATPVEEPVYAAEPSEPVGKESADLVTEEVEAVVPVEAEQTMQDTAPGFQRAYGDAIGGAPTEGEIHAGLVTETMAELYSSQGFHDRAADVYRALLRLRPSDERLSARLRAAEEAASPSVESIVELDETGELWLRDAGAAWTGAQTPHPGDATLYAWTDEGEDAPSGEPIGAFLRDLISWRSAATAAVAAPAEPAIGLPAEPEPEPEPEPLWLEEEVSREEGAAAQPSAGAAPWEAPAPEQPAAPLTPAPWESAAPATPAPAAPAPWEATTTKPAAPTTPAPWEPPPAAAPVAPEPWAPPAMPSTAPAEEPWAPVAAAAPEPAASEPAPAPVAAAPVAAAPAPPVPAPAPPRAAPAPPVRTGDAVADAFNEWFSASEPTEPMVPMATAAAETTPAPEPAPEPVEEADEDEDLEMFRSWLQSLKK